MDVAIYASLLIVFGFIALITIITVIKIIGKILGD